MSSRFRSIAGLAGTAFTLLLASSCADRLVAPPMRGTAASRSIVRVEEPSGIALSFNGASSWAATTNVVALTSDDIRLEAWINWSGPTASQSQTIVYNGVPDWSGWGIMLKDGKVAILAGRYGFPTTTLAPSIGVWQHVSAERHADNTVVVELDGVTQTVSVAAGVPYLGGLSGTMVGAAAHPFAPNAVSMVFKGSIDNVRVMKLDGTLLDSWDFENATSTTTEGSKGAHLALHDVGLLTLGTLDVVIDPRHENRVIEPERGRSVAVAVLSSPEFDATTIDRSTVTFGPAHASALTANRVDVDDDGDSDMLYRFDLSDAGITCMDRRATLRATAAGVPASGTAGIHTVLADLPAGDFIVRCASPRIIATDLWTTQPGQFTPLSINDRGQIAGYTVDLFGNLTPARLDDDVLVPADIPMFFGGETPISDRGQMGLTMYDLNYEKSSAFLWSGNSVTPLAVGDDFAFVQAINDHGDAAGAIGATFGDPSAFWLMRNGKLDKLATNANRRYMSAIGMTNAGLVGLSFYDETTGQSHVALWNGKKVNVLTRSDESASPVAMNERGQIVGTSILVSDLSQVKPTMWTDAGVITLAPAGYPLAINKRGDVAIQDEHFIGISIWRQGGLTPVGTGGFGGMNDDGDLVLITASGPVLHLSNGSRIPLFDGQLRDRHGTMTMMNNSGEIVGYSYAASFQQPMIWRVSRR